MSKTGESIYIKNFGGIEEALIPLNDINIFIGPQASGKSVTAKLVYFFKTFWGLFYTLRNKYPDFQSWEKEEFITGFYKYFPSENWGELDFVIEYSISADYSIKITRNKVNKIKIEYPNDLVLKLSSTLEKENDSNIFGTQSKSDLLGYLKSIENISQNKIYYFQFYIPAVRTFFSTFQSSLFSILSQSNNSIDPFLTRFGAVYEKIVEKNEFYKLLKDENTKPLFEKALNLLKIDDFVKKNRNIFYLKHKSNREVNLETASSGQQAMFPLLLSLLSVFKEDLFPTNSKVMYIEEPEAHIFPETQKQLMELLSIVFNRSKPDLQFIITTHSPYILTSFNNLIQAGAIEREIEDKEKLYNIVPQHQILQPNTVNAYEFRDGKVENLIDSETGFILAERLDTVSEDIAIQFDKLLDLKYSKL